MIASNAEASPCAVALSALALVYAIAAAAPGEEWVGPTAAEMQCPRGFVNAAIAGRHRCLKRGQPLQLRPRTVASNRAELRDLAHPDVATGHLAKQDLAATTKPCTLAYWLRASSYDWQFVPEGGATFTDSGSAPCH